MDVLGKCCRNGSIALVSICVNEEFGGAFSMKEALWNIRACPLRK
jgi:hypothetical protein